MLVKQQWYATYTLDCITLFWRNTNVLCARRQRNTLSVVALGEQLHELLGITGNQLRKLRIRGADLLQDVLEHGRLLLNKLPQVLEGGIVAQEVKILPFASLQAGGGSLSGRSAAGSTTSASSTLIGCCCDVEKINGVVGFAGRGGCR